MRDILRVIKYWIIRKFEPCDPEVECQNCEYFKMQIEIMRQEKNELLAKLFVAPEETRTEQTVPQVVHRTKHVPWRVKQAELENQDRKLAEEIKKNSSVMAKPDNEEGINGTDVQSIEELETELGIPNTGAEVKNA